MRISPSILFLVLSSLSLLTLALNPALQKNLFFVSADNHLSYELYQTHNGTLAHSFENVDGNTYISRYILINLDTRDALPILSELVSLCDNANPFFQSLHYHAQTDSLVYYCAKNSSLLILNQQDHTVQEAIPLVSPSSLPVAKLSTADGTNVAILLMDTLFVQSPKNSILLKVNMQTKTLTAQILFNQNLNNNEAVVAYTTNKNSAYVATNFIQGNDLTITVYSVVLTGNAYQLTKVTSEKASITSSKIITKLLCLQDYVVINNGANLSFLDQQGTVLASVQVQIKPLSSQNNAVFLPAVMTQYDGTNVYTLLSSNGISIYSIVNNALQRQDIPGSFGDLQVAFRNPGDMIFTLDNLKKSFSIYDPKTLQLTYQTASDYVDIMLTDTTYAVVQALDGTNSSQVSIFSLKSDTLLTKIPLSTKFYYNKDQHIITFLNAQSAPGCILAHIDVASGKNWTTLSFPDGDAICSSFVANARITEKGNPEAVFPFSNSFEILSETLGRQTLRAISASAIDTDSISVNYQNLILYYLSANQRTNQLIASLMAFDPATKNFLRVNTNVLQNRPVKNQGLFVLDDSTTVALSSTGFAFVNKLNAAWSRDNFANNYNMLTAFVDNTKTQFTLFGYNNSKVINGTGPMLFSSSKAFIAVPYKRSNTVNGRATGTSSFCLHDDLNSNMGIFRFFSSDPLAKTLISM